MLCCQLDPAAARVEKAAQLAALATQLELSLREAVDGQFVQATIQARQQAYNTAATDAAQAATAAAAGADEPPFDYWVGTINLPFEVPVETKIPYLLAMDANTCPQFERQPSVAGTARHNCWQHFKQGPWLRRSVWDSYFDAHGTPNHRSHPPVSVNKMRGPLSGQPAKIGLHALELIDHVWYSDGLQLVAHVVEPTVFADTAAATSRLIPSLQNPSDHYPVVVDLMLMAELCCFAPKSRSWEPAGQSPFFCVTTTEVITETVTTETVTENADGNTYTTTVTQNADGSETVVIESNSSIG